MDRLTLALPAVLIPLLAGLCTAQAENNKQQWYKKALVGVETGPTGAQFGIDPHEAGYAAKFSGKDMVEAAVKANCDYVVVWAKDSEFAYYNSNVAPRCPGLAGRDPLREAVDSAKKYNLPVIAYCVVQGNGYPLRNHPEFKMVGCDGKPMDRICLNSGYMEHAKAVVDEMIAYGIDGFHIDMLDQGFGPPYGCWCDRCKKLYEAEYKHAMPPGVTWDAPWDEMMKFRYDTSARFEKELLDHIRSVSPALSVDFNYHGYPPFSWEVGQRPVQHAHIGDFVTCESGVWGFSALGAGLTAQFVRATGPTETYQVVMSRGVRIYHDQTSRPLNDLRWELFSLLANGAQVTIVDKTPYDGTIDPVTYERIGKAFAEARAKKQHFGQPLVHDVGIYYSARTRDWIGRENPGKYEQSFFGAHKALVYEHIPYGILLDENVSADLLKTYPVVLLADVAILNDQEVEMLKTYVEQGGNLVVSGVSGTHNRMGKQCSESALAELIGAKIDGIVKDRDNFIKLPPVDKPLTALNADIPPDWPVLVYGSAVIYQPTTAQPVGKLLKPIRTLHQIAGKEGTSFPSSAGDPVGPALIINSVGKGKVVTLAVSPGAATASEYHTVEARKLLRNVIRFLQPEPEILIHAPLNIETVVSDDPTARMLRVHFVGYLSPPATTSPDRPKIIPELVEDVPLYRAELLIKRPFTEVGSINPNTKIDRNGQKIKLLIEDIHEVIVIKY